MQMVSIDADQSRDSKPARSFAEGVLADRWVGQCTGNRPLLYGKVEESMLVGDGSSHSDVTAFRCRLRADKTAKVGPFPCFETVSALLTIGRFAPLLCQIIEIWS